MTPSTCSRPASRDRSVCGMLKSVCTCGGPRDLHRVMPTDVPARVRVGKLTEHLMHKVCRYTATMQATASEWPIANLQREHQPKKWEQRPPSSPPRKTHHDVFTRGFGGPPGRDEVLVGIPEAHLNVHSNVHRAGATHIRTYTQTGRNHPTPPGTLRAAPRTHPGATARRHRAQWSRDYTDCIHDALSTHTLPLGHGYQAGAGCSS